MRVYRELLKIAMVGTSRSELLRASGRDVPSSLDQLLAEVREEDSARAFLKQAAIVSVYRRAGRRRRHSEGWQHPPVAPEEDRQRCPDAAARRLATMLDGPRQRFLPEWFAAVERAAQRVPEELLPSLLDLASKRKEWRNSIRPLLGRRGEWLSQFNPAWSWMLGEAEMVEPESDVRDRDQALVKRQIDRVQPLLDYRARPLQRDTIELRLPSKFDRSMSRDGITRTPRSPGIGERQWWLQQMLAGIPAGYWARHWRKTAREIVRAAARSEWHSLLLAGWTGAVRCYPETDWIEALLDERLEEQSEEGIDIIELLPADRQESFLIKALKRSTALAVDQPSYWFLTRSSHPWSRQVGKLLLPMLRREREVRQTRAVWDWEELLREAGRRLDPRMAAEAAAELAGEVRSGSPLAPALAEFLGDLEFRAEMIKEIKR